MARRPLKRSHVALAALAALAVAAVAVVATTVYLSGRDGGEVPSSTAEDARAPEGARVRVQVVNATATRGLARRATQLLRDRGFDVVETGTAAEQLDTTLVLDRSGHPDWARRVAAVLGTARVEARPDSSRYLDITVLIGRSWRPPAQPFYP